MKIKMPYFEGISKNIKTKLLKRCVQTHFQGAQELTTIIRCKVTRYTDSQLKQKAPLESIYFARRKSRIKC